MMKDFDAIVIGTGQSGPFPAARMAAAGQRVAIIERHRFGGKCVNNGTPNWNWVLVPSMLRRATW
jgi:pyruvate/2-oxoglutarate dehydrogenase complex dihydrolipoamide dehydrogenase (E3) component